MKTLQTSVRIALRALRVNRTRSALTMLGIIIGVATVIAMVGVGSGATERIQEEIQSIGSRSYGHAPWRIELRVRSRSHPRRHGPDDRAHAAIPRTTRRSTQLIAPWCASSAADAMSAGDASGRSMTSTATGRLTMNVLPTPG